MADWNTSSSRNKNALERLMDDPKKVTAAVVGLGALLVGVWALSFLDKKGEPEQASVAFTLPDPQKALPPTGSGMLVAKAKAPVDKPSDAEADALKSLEAEAAHEVADAPAGEAEADDSEIPVEGEDENGAPGRPLAEAAGWLGGNSSGGGSAGGFVPSASGGAGGGSGSGASLAAGVGPGTAVADAGGPSRTVSGAAGSGRTVTSGARALRSGSIGGASGATGGGVGAGANNRFAPAGATGNVYGAGAGVG
ncbi:hypothetical protein EPO15_09425, partial [bacterium]